MTLGLAGRAIAGVGIVCGLLAVGLDLISAGGHYVADGTSVAFLVTLLALASHFPAEIGSDARGAAMGAVAFGFLLYIPAGLAFDNLGSLGSGSWLGVCTGLIPIGYALLWKSEHGHAAPGTSASRHAHRDPYLLATTLGLALVAVGVWLPITSGDSYWDASHTLALLMLLLVVVNAYLAVRAPASSDAALIAAATTFGLVGFAWVAAAFESFDRLGSGGWLEAFGGLFLMFGILAARRAASSAPAGAPAAAPAQ